MVIAEMGYGSYMYVGPFRGMFDTAYGGDLSRVRKDFEAEWRDRFKDTPPPPCADESS